MAFAYEWKKKKQRCCVCSKSSSELFKSGQTSTLKTSPNHLRGKKLKMFKGGGGGSVLYLGNKTGIRREGKESRREVSSKRDINCIAFWLSCQRSRRGLCKHFDVTIVHAINYWQIKRNWCFCIIIWYYVITWYIK